jgi:hypothetical protein
MKSLRIKISFIWRCLAALRERAIFTTDEH